MMIDSLFRREGFWTLDTLKGGTIRKHYLDIVSKMSNDHIQNYSDELGMLMDHARISTPFYRRINESKDLIKIEDFPVITKNDIKIQFKDFQSDKFQNKPLHNMSTSGSTGTPFTVNQDMNKRKRVLAEIIYFNEIAGQRLGEKYIFFRVWTEKNRKTKFQLLQQNMVPIDILRLDDTNLEKIRTLLKKDKSINSALGYASTYEHLIKYLSDNGDTPDMFNIKLLVTSSEVLDMQSKKILKELFGCNIVDRYSNQENGIIAQTPDFSDEFIVNRASYYVELLKIDSNEPADNAELSRIVVTDLYNFAMPIIRYDTGDLAICCDGISKGAHKLKSIQGRRVDTIYDTQGNKLTAHTWGVYMWKFDKLKQYQFIQEDSKKYLLKVSGAEGIYSREELDKTLRDILGEDAEIDIHFVDTIPVLASGKFKKTVCNYQPKDK